MKLSIKDAKDYPGDLARDLAPFGISELNDSWSASVSNTSNSSFKRKFLAPNTLEYDVIKHFMPRATLSSVSSYNEEADITTIDYTMTFYATPNFRPIGSGRSPVVRATSATINPMPNIKVNNGPVFDGVHVLDADKRIVEIGYDHVGAMSFYDEGGADRKGLRLNQILTETFEITSEFKTIPDAKYLWGPEKTEEVTNADIPGMIFSYDTWKYKLRFLPLNLYTNDLLNRVNDDILYSYAREESYDVGRVLLVDVKPEKIINFDGQFFINAEFTYLICPDGETWNKFPRIGQDSWVSIYPESDPDNAEVIYKSGDLGRYIIEKGATDTTTEYNGTSSMWWD